MKIIIKVCVPQRWFMLISSNYKNEEMERRNFIKSTAVSAIAFSTSGFVMFDGHRFVGDCETTTDVLGPFYRPDSPVRESLVIAGEKGDPISLFGKIIHDDCITPYKNAKIELWHCDGYGIYDNESADFNITRLPKM